MCNYSAYPKMHSHIDSVIILIRQALLEVYISFWMFFLLNEDEYAY